MSRFGARMMAGRVRASVDSGEQVVQYGAGQLFVSRVRSGDVPGTEGSVGSYQPGDTVPAELALAWLATKVARRLWSGMVGSGGTCHSGQPMTEVLNMTTNTDPTGA